MNDFELFINKIDEDNPIKKADFTIESHECMLVYHGTLSKVSEFNQFFVHKINDQNITKLNNSFPGTFTKISEISEYIFEDILLTGNIILYVKDENLLYRIVLKNVLSRNITESTADSTHIYSGKDGFVEELDKNIALIQKRIKNDKLTIEKDTIGNKNPSTINIVYIKGVANKVTISEIKNKIKAINVDTITSTTDITHVFNESSLFPLVAHTSSPSNTVNSLYNGRVAILIDEFPIAIILPINLSYFINIAQEPNPPFYYSIYHKLIIYLMLFISIFFLGIYVAILNYHAENLSLIMISEVKVTARGTTVPLFVEILVILLIFEILKIASAVTISGSLQNIIVIVGGLLIGQNTVSSGFIGSFNLVITTICYFSTFGVTNSQHLITAISIIRIVVLLASILMGMYGLVLTSIVFIIYLFNLKSVNFKYLFPISPFIPKQILRMFIPKLYTKGKK